MSIFRMMQFGPLREEAAEGGEGGGGGDGGLLTGGAPAAGTPAEGSQGDQGTPAAGGGFTFAGSLSDTGDFKEGWLEGAVAAHPELEAHAKTLQNYKNPIAALKALGETKSLVGRKLEDVNTVLNPNPDDPTAMALYRSTVGVPDQGSLAAYEYQVPEELKDQSERFEEVAKWAHENNIPKTTFHKMVEKQLELSQQDAQALVEQQQAAEAKEKADWLAGAQKEFGENTDKNLDLVVRLLRGTGMADEEIAASNVHKMGLPMLKALVGLASKTTEARLPTGGTPASQANDAAAELKAIQTDPSHPKYAIYQDPGHPDNATVRAEVLNLIKKVNAAKKR